MKISGFLKQTLIDYSGKLAAEVFTAGCNYRCPSCHARHVIEGREQHSEEEVFAYLKKAKGFVDGIVICGGEPTIHLDLPDFLRKVKQETGLPIKLDTNGSNPAVLQELLKDKLVDYVAMDIKGPSNLYSQLIGKSHIDLRDDVEKSIGVVQNAPDYEFRTTAVPFINGITSVCNRLADPSKFMRWMTSEEMRDMAEWVRGFIPDDTKEVKWYLQKFVARKKDEGAMLDERFSKENLPKEYHETPESLLKKMQEAGKQAGINFLLR